MFGGGKMTEYEFGSYILHNARGKVIRGRRGQRKQCQKVEERREGVKFIVMNEQVSLLEDKVGYGA